MSRKIIIMIVVATLILITGLMMGCPKYNVYMNEMSGKAEFSKAEWSKKIMITEAQARAEAMEFEEKAEIKKAGYEAQQEIIRAGGIAEANKIIGESLKGKTEYLRYLWIQTLADKDNEVIYVPTEANLPILEASRKR